MSDAKARRAYIAYYTPARWPERIQAPTPWRDQALVIAADVALTAALAGRVPETAVATYLTYPAHHAILELDGELRRRSARRLGLTAETAPPSSTVQAGSFPLRGHVRRVRVAQVPRGNPTPPMRWPVFLAMRLVYAVNERRSWNAATASRDG